MRILYDNVIFSLQRAGGISIYFSEMIKRFSQCSNVKFWELPCNNVFRNQLDILPELESRLPVCIVRYMPFLKKNPARSIFHSSYYRVSLQKKVANITTVHDFTYEYFRKGLARHIHAFQKGFAIRRSAGIICVSEHTRQDLLSFYPEVDPSRVKVVHNGVGTEFFPLESKELLLKKICNNLCSEKYLLYVGDRSSYKNFDKAVQVTAQYQDLSLVVIGGKEFSDTEKKMLKPLKGRFFHYKGISSGDLNIFYNNAFCLLYPSSYEGFGIPVLEAMRAGCPVVAVNASSIPEVAGDAGLLVDRIDADAFSDKVFLLRDRVFRQNLIEKGMAQAALFSWDRCFNETFSFYKEIYERSFGSKS